MITHDHARVQALGRQGRLPMGIRRGCTRLGTEKAKRHGAPGAIFQNQAHFGSGEGIITGKPTSNLDLRGPEVSSPGPRKVLFNK